jgi:integrase
VRHASQAKRVRRRSVPLTPRAHFALARLLRAPLPGGPLFSISVRGVNFVVETLGRRANITRLKKLTPEILRDTFAVRAMRDLIEQETTAASHGATPRELERLRARHDLHILQLLGLSRYSDMAARYRAAAAADLPSADSP